MIGERRFTFRECRELLAINPKSFLGWLEKAGIDPDTQVDKFDPRKKFLTMSQLKMLAEAHGRELPPFDDVEPPRETLTLEALAEQLVLAQQQVMERFEQLDHALSQVMMLLQKPSQIVSMPHETSHSNGGKSSGDVAVIVSSPPVQVKTSPPKPTAKKKKAVRRGKKLPAGLMLLRDFTGQHHIPTERASTAGKTGKIKVVLGKWLVNSRWATEALDAQGRYDFYEVFHEREGFTVCEQCPHRLP